MRASATPPNTPPRMGPSVGWWVTGNDVVVFVEEELAPSEDVDLNEVFPEVEVREDVSGVGVEVVVVVESSSSAV